MNGKVCYESAFSLFGLMRDTWQEVVIRRYNPTAINDVDHIIQLFSMRFLHECPELRTWREPKVNREPSFYKVSCTLYSHLIYELMAPFERVSEGGYTVYREGVAQERITERLHALDIVRTVFHRDKGLDIFVEVCRQILFDDERKVSIYALELIVNALCEFVLLEFTERGIETGRLKDLVGEDLILPQIEE